MSHPIPSDSIRTLDLLQQVITDAAAKLTGGCERNCKGCRCGDDQATPDDQKPTTNPSDDHARPSTDA